MSKYLTPPSMKACFFEKKTNVGVVELIHRVNRMKIKQQDHKCQRHRSDVLRKARSYQEVTMIWPIM